MVQDEVRISIHASRITGKVILAALKWLFNNKEKIKVHGEVGMKELHKQSDNVKFLPHELDKKEITAYAREFKKYGILFAVEKQDEGKYVLAFAGRNEESIEYAMKKILEKETAREESKFKASKQKHEDYQKNKQEQEQDKDKSKEKNSSRDERSR
ncbi:MAG: PcfB family protein [Defluviitaleaceae bacterium]|nr:PcfB family protein [Defluviitaleaceae bacterium]